MSARSRARKNKRRQLVPHWDLVIARTNYNWVIFAKKAKKRTGLYPIMFNPRQNGRIYSRRVMLEALSKSMPVRGLNGEAMKGVMAHPSKVDKDGNLGIDITIDSPFDKPDLKAFIRKHPPIEPNPPKGPSDEWLKALFENEQPSAFSIRAICDENKQPKDILGWNWIGQSGAEVERFANAMLEQVGIDQSLVGNIDPELLKAQHGEFGGLCKPRTALAVPPRIPPLKAYDQSVESEDMTATQVIHAQMLMERANRKILDDIGGLQDLLGAERKPFDEFYLSAPINVYEIFEHCLTILPDGGWIPKPDFHNVNIDQLKTPHKSGPFILAVVAANEHSEFRQRLEQTGFAKLKVVHNTLDFANHTPLQQTRYFLITLDGVINQLDPHGFRFDTRPSVFNSAMMRHMLLEEGTHGDQ